MNQSSTVVRLAAPPPLFQVRSLQSCRECGHRLGEHVGLPDTALARQLSRIHGGCLDCETCGDE
jgi:hypothetical protein